MNKILSTALLVCLLSATALALPMFEETEDARMQYRYSIMFARSEAHKIGMEAVLDYLGDDATEELQAPYNDFVGHYGDLETAKNSVDFDSLWDIRLAMIAEAERFRTEARSILGDDTAGARAAVTAALLDQEDYLATLEEVVYDEHVNVLFAIFDADVGAFENKFAEFRGRGMDPSELEVKLAEIEARRTLLEDNVKAAYDSCIGDLILVCDTAEHTDYVAYRNETNNKFRELRGETNKFMNRGWIDSSRKRVDDAIAKLDDHPDVDTSELEAKLNDILSVLDEAEAALDNEDFSTMQEKLHESRDLFREYVQDARDILKKTIHTARLGALEATVSTVGDRIQAFADKGADTTGHEDELANAEAALEEAGTLCASGDLEGCASKMDEVLESLKLIKALPVPTHAGPGGGPPEADGIIIGGLDSVAVDSPVVNSTEVSL